MSTQPILDIQNLSVRVAEKPIINGLSLTIEPGTVHAIMGPNGSGKSTLANVLARHPDYEITGGSIRFHGQDLTALSPEECAHLGLFLSFQYPVAIPGVSNIAFMKASVNAMRKAQNKPPLDAVDFLALVKEHMKTLHMPDELLKRPINEGFSGGEKKRNEILQMRLLEPSLAILDETDSGLDIDALKMVAENVNASRSPNRAILLITHYQRLLDYIEPDFVHVISKGQLVHSGDKHLPKTLEEKGYAWIEEGSV